MLCFAMKPPYGQATRNKPIPRIGYSHYHEEETRQPIHRFAVSLAYRLPMACRQIRATHLPPTSDPDGVAGVYPLNPVHK